MLAWGGVRMGLVDEALPCARWNVTKGTQINMPPRGFVPPFDGASSPHLMLRFTKTPRFSARPPTRLHAGCVRYPSLCGVNPAHLIVDKRFLCEAMNRSFSPHLSRDGSSIPAGGVQAAQTKCGSVGDDEDNTWRKRERWQGAVGCSHDVRHEHDDGSGGGGDVSHVEERSPHRGNPTATRATNS